jgi:phenylpropionate dioxygenase-like ring-hydroxylating dioxygenase large terminal subunit
MRRSLKLFIHPYTIMIAIGRRSTLPAMKAKRVLLREQPYVLFKDQQQKIHFFPDACLHRGMSLSEGKVLPNGCLECPYHGWRYRENTYQPPSHPVGTPRSLPLTLKEKDDILWTSADASAEPTEVPYWNEDGFRKVHFEARIQQSAQLIIENGIDPTHASWVHANPFGFGTYMERPKNMFDVGDNGIAFDYAPNPYTLPALMLGFNTTFNVHFFELPYTTWSEVIITERIRLMTFVTLVPEKERQTRMMVVFARNFLTSPIFDSLFVVMGRAIVEQDRHVLERLDPRFEKEGVLMDEDDALIRKYRDRLQEKL